jgi:N-acetylmuramic acid 6-phosphate etherase
MNTEKQAPEKLWIDKMSSKEAIKSMLKNQAEAIPAVENDMVSILAASDAMYAKLLNNNNSRIIYVGAGTSARIAVQDGVELYPTFSWPLSRVDYIVAGDLKALTSAVEGAEDDISFAKNMFKKKKISHNDVVIGLTASSSTPFTLELIEMARKVGAITIGIGNNPNGKVQEIAEYGITLDTGHELVAGSTRLKAGTAQKICLNIISTLCMSRLGGVKNGLMINLQPSNNKLKKRISMIKNKINKE